MIDIVKPAPRKMSNPILHICCIETATNDQINNIQMILLQAI